MFGRLQGLQPFFKNIDYTLLHFPKAGKTCYLFRSLFQVTLSFADIPIPLPETGSCRFLQPLFENCSIMPMLLPCFSLPRLAFRPLTLIVLCVLTCLQDLSVAHPLEDAGLLYSTFTSIETTQRLIQNATITAQHPPTTAVQNTAPGTKGVRCPIAISNLGRA